MNGVAGDALENLRRSLLSEATMELESHQRQSHEHLQEYKQGVRRHLSEDPQEEQVSSREEVAILRHNCLSLLLKDHMIKTYDKQIWYVRKFFIKSAAAT